MEFKVQLGVSIIMSALFVVIIYPNSTGHLWKPYNKLIVLRHFASNLLTFIYTCLFVKNCPFCQAAIYKHGGCSHINCAKCKERFCWVCMRSRGTIHSEKICFLNIFVYYFLIFHMIFMQLEVLGLREKCINILIIGFFGSINLLFMNLTIILPLIVVISLINIITNSKTYL
jgi:hypothetical protein